MSLTKVCHSREYVDRETVSLTQGMDQRVPARQRQAVDVAARVPDRGHVVKLWRHVCRERERERVDITGLPGLAFWRPKKNKFDLFFQLVCLEIFENLLSSWPFLVYIKKFM